VAVSNGQIYFFSTSVWLCVFSVSLCVTII